MDSSTIAPTVQEQAESGMFAVDVRRTKSWLGMVWLTLAAFVLALSFWNGRSEHRALHQLPAPLRKELFERTLRTLQSPCDSNYRFSGLEDYCKQQAHFILEFAECDQACVELARRQVPSRAR